MSNVGYEKGRSEAAALNQRTCCLGDLASSWLKLIIQGIIFQRDT